MRKNPAKPLAQRHIGSEGLRVFALLGVSAFHLRPDLVPGGFLAVVSFFVLAGYYTSRSFLRRREINLPAYYWNKISKLWPPLLFLLGTISVFSYALIPEVFHDLRNSLLSATGGWHNIAQILADRSYFNRHGNFDPTTHLWALSLEMQFYLFFPILLWLLGQLKRLLPAKRKEYIFEVIGGVFAFLSVISAIYMAVIFVPGADPTPVYYNSFARASAFLVGAAANLIVSGSKMRREKEGLPPHQPWEPAQKAALAWILLALLILPYFLVSFQSNIVFRGGMFIYSLFAISYILVAGEELVSGMEFMASSPFRWLASRSYTLYLWQYAFMIIFEAAFRFSTLSYWTKIILQLLFLALIAEISWRLFEEKTPYEKDHPIGKRIELSRNASAAVMAFLLVICFFAPLPALANNAQIDGDMIMDAIQSNQSKLAEREDQLSEEKEKESSAPTDKDGKVIDSKIEEERESKKESETSELVIDETTNPYGFTPEECEKLANTNMVMIGDSVLAMALDGIYAYNPNAYIDAAVSRHFFQGPEILNTLDASGVPSDVIVIALSTNGDIFEPDMDSYREIANGRPLIFVNTVVPNTWEQPNNKKLADFAKKNKGVYLADWYAEAKSHPEYFYDDATHPTPDGAAIYDKVVLKAILEALQ